MASYMYDQKGKDLNAPGVKKNWKNYWALLNSRRAMLSYMYIEEREIYVSSFQPSSKNSNRYKILYGSTFVQIWNNI